jgi:tRNA A-37 threonylcarbamoyl transferase component Bud32
MKKIGVGRSAEVFIDNEGKALKLFFEWVKPAQIEYEADISQKIVNVYKEAPIFFGVINQEGKLGLQYELIQGEMLSDVMKRQPFRIVKLARELGEIHRRMHSSKVEGLATMRDVYGDRLLRYPNLINNLKDELIEFLERDINNSLCHGDFHPENVMVDTDERMWVVDWVNAYSGNPVSDVARTYYLLKKGTSPEKSSLLIRVFEVFTRHLIARAYLKSYFKAQKFPKAEFDKWLLIIQITRYSEGIKEEQAYLVKVITRAQRKHKNK